MMVPWNRSDQIWKSGSYFFLNVVQDSFGFFDHLEFWPVFEDLGVFIMIFERNHQTFWEFNHVFVLDHAAKIVTFHEISPWISLPNLRWLGNWVDLSRFWPVVDGSQEGFPSILLLASEETGLAGPVLRVWVVWVQPETICYEHSHNHSNPIPQWTDLSHFTSIWVLDAFARWRQDYLISRLRKVWFHNLHVIV